MATAVLVFLLPLILFRIAASVIANLVSAASLGGLDRLLGLAFGVFRGALIVCAAYLVLSMLMVPERQPVWIEEARLLPQVREGAFMLTRVLPENASLLGELVRPPRRRSPAPRVHHWLCRAGLHRRATRQCRPPARAQALNERR